MYSFERLNYNNRGITITNACQRTSKETIRKPNQIWVDKGSESHNKSMKSWPEKNDKEMYSTDNKGKSFIAERFIRTLKNNIYKYMTSISKNVYIDELDDIVNRYNNAYHRTIKMKPAEVKPNKHIDFDKENNEEGPNWKLVIM